MTFPLSLLALALVSCGGDDCERANCVPLPDSGSTPATDSGGTTDTIDSDTGTAPVDTDTGVPTTGDGLLDVSGWDPVQPAVVTIAPVPLVPGETATITYSGLLAGESAVSVHYGFNGWNEVSGLDGLESEVTIGDSDWFIDAPMVANGDGTHTATVALPTDGRALHMVFTGGDSGDWDNNDLDDFGEGLVFPYAGPWLTWSNEVGPADGVIVNFQTGVSCLGTVEYGPTEAFGHHVVGTELGTVHHIAIPDVAPGSTVYYRVYDSRGRVSETYRLTTPDADADTASLLIMGDMQDGGATQRWKGVAAEAAATHGDVDAIFLVGDMAYNDKPGHWWTFFDKGRPLLGTVPVLPVPGNHDTPGTASTTQLASFVKYFPLPYSDGAGTDTDTHWSLRVGPVALLGFNSEDVEGLQPDYGDQYGWATQALTEHADASWVFAAWHVPPYNVGGRHFLEQHDTRELTGLFDGVLDWVFCGHEHLAQRLLPLRHSGILAPSGAYGRGPDDGVGYMIAPPAGNDPSDQVIPPDSEWAYYRDRLAWPPLDPERNYVDSELGFIRADVSGEQLRLRTYGMGDLDAPKAAWVREDLTVERGTPPPG